MFGLFSRDPLARLDKQRQRKYRQAMEAEKFGDRARQAELYAEAADIESEMERLRNAPAR
jgi:hypothetical protein